MQNSIVSKLEDALMEQWSLNGDDAEAHYPQEQKKSRSYIGQKSRGDSKDTPSSEVFADDFEDQSFWNGYFHVPDRAGATSAPPAYGVQSDTLFAFRAMYAGIFSDIRCEQNYHSFYQQYKDNDKLPKPLNPDPAFFGSAYPNTLQFDKAEDAYANRTQPVGIAAKKPTQKLQQVVTEEQLMNRFSFKDVMLPDLSDSEYENDLGRKKQPDDSANESEDPKRLWEQYDENRTSRSGVSQRPFQEPVPDTHPRPPYPYESQVPPHPGIYGDPHMSQRHPAAYPPTYYPPASRQPPGISSGYPFSGMAPPVSVPPSQMPHLSHIRSAPPGLMPSTPVDPRNAVPVNLPHSPAYSPVRPPPPHGVVEPSERMSVRENESPEKNAKGKNHRRSKSSGVSPRKGDASSRYTSMDQVVGQISALCKDQHGCRFLQKKLEDNDHKVTELIFNETYPYFEDLMIDPFGNYLCQKLLEYCDNNQRTLAIQKVASELVNISKNMHGTRAVQKMIECLTTPEQVALVREGLRDYVVELIQDLNGNHVIQRCLNRLSNADNQFIYDSVAGHCVEVATHRHGCCVLQRCLDHASDSQKMQLVREITANALPLVQDPYGNYVVQYVLDLPFRGMCANVAAQLSGQLCALSCQKFSSNVIEKLLKKGENPMRDWMVREVMEDSTLNRLLQDPFGNYVIQTSIGVSLEPLRSQLIEAIKPHLPALRNTPYGKRIQSKILQS